MPNASDQSDTDGAAQWLDLRTPRDVGFARPDSWRANGLIAAATEMRKEPQMKKPISLILLGLTLVPVASATTYLDDFPAALSNYVYGGWQGPYGDGTAGRLFPTGDGTGIYMDATYNGYVWALRSSPEFTDADMTMQFVLPNRDYTTADSFRLLMLFHNPTTPPDGSCIDCSLVVPESGLSLNFRMGSNVLGVARYAGGEVVSSTIVPLPPVALNEPHEARAVYDEGSLIVYLDSVQLLSWSAPDVPAGQVGFDVYRVDMIVDVVSIVGTEQPVSVSESSWGEIKGVYRE